MRIARSHHPSSSRLLGILLVVLAVTLAACQTTPIASGIEGLVTIGPISPVEQPGVPNERPYQATIVVKNDNEKTVATVDSGSDGRFRLELEPGDYVLEPQSPGQMPHAQPMEVTVQAHQFTKVTISYDSGIR